MNIVESIENPAWKRAIRDFRNYLTLERQLSDNSVDAYLRDVSHLAMLAVGKGKSPDAVNLEDLRELVGFGWLEERIVDRVGRTAGAQDCG